jgi:hypothetical protein
VAYHTHRALVVDVNDRPPPLPHQTPPSNPHWGIGNRAGFFLAMDLCLSREESQSLITPEQDPSPLLLPSVPPLLTPPPSILSTPLSLEDEKGSDKEEINRIKISSLVDPNSLIVLLSCSLLFFRKRQQSSSSTSASREMSQRNVCN